MTTSEEIFDRLADLARAKFYFFSDIWTRSRKEFGPPWVTEIVDNIVRLFGSEESPAWESVLGGYAEFSLDAMRNQKFFEKHRRYRASRLDEIQSRYYDNEDHMMNNYLPGMYLSHYLWPHHFKLLTFFRTEVLPSLASAAVFYDVGIGTGLYSREVLRAWPQSRGAGFDISPHSVAFTRRLLQAYGLLDRYEFVLGNIFSTALPPRPADFLVSQEVLEHLEEPERFCRILHGLTRVGSQAYITAAVNAAHSDHIYLFRSADEVRQMLTTAGWKVLKARAEFAYQGQPLDVTPCVVGFLCES